MSQDTRKDPRAKVLTMTVRYKSATLDEFIEHHSYDVSRGGMFIKTPSPFPPGTLLKFEVKIAADQKVIQGVGRVVWKRDNETSGDSRPAGMGVKFIKIDDASRKVIDTLVESRGEGSSAYEAGGGDSGVPAVASKAPAAAGGDVPKAPAARKATMIGLGAMNPSARPAPAPTPAPPAAEKPAASFFPETKSEADMPPPEDRTVMKQAAELLQDALRGAGSSLEDVASSSKYDPPPAKSTSKPADSAPAVASAVEKPVSEKPVASAKPVSEKPAAEAKPASVKPAAAAAPASVKPASLKPAAAKPAAAKATTKSTIPAQRRAAAPAVPAATTDSSSGGGGRVVVISLIIAAVAGLVYAFSPSKPPEPTPAPVASAPPAPAPTPSEAPVAVDTASAAPVESAAPPTSASAAASAAPVESAAPVVSAPPVVPAVAVPKPAPVLNVRPIAKPKPKPVAEPSEPSAPEPAAPSAPSEPTAEKPAAPVAPSPPPAPKPVEPAGDNPY